MTASLIAVVFAWYQEPAAVRTQPGDSVVVPIVRYVIPAVLAVVTEVRLIANADFPGWHELPGAQFIEALPGAAGTLAWLVVLYVVGRLLVRLLPESVRPGRRRRR